MNGDRMPAPLEALVRALAGGDGEDDRRATTFARGLALGAFVGAAIAGSTIWSRRHTLGTVARSAPPSWDRNASATDAGAAPPRP